MQMEYGKVHPIQSHGKGSAGLVDSAQFAQMAALAAGEKKAGDVRILDIRSISPIADFFVICSGTSSTHARAIADFVEAQVEANGLVKHHMEGYQNGRWILLDFGDVVVHVMQEDDRAFYNLERLWGDAVIVEMTVPAAG